MVSPGAGGQPQVGHSLAASRAARRAAVYALAFFAQLAQRTDPSIAGAVQTRQSPALCLFDGDVGQQVRQQ
jgi:hypothetical protein